MASSTHPLKYPAMMPSAAPSGSSTSVVTVPMTRLTRIDFSAW